MTEMECQKENTPSTTVEPLYRRNGSTLSVESQKSRNSGQQRRVFQASHVADAEEEIAYFENLQRIRKAFQENDLNNDGVITAGELKFLGDKLGEQVYTVENLNQIIDGLKVIAKARGSTDDRLDEEGIPFEIFVQILYSREADREMDAELYESVRKLRNFFRDCSNARVLAEAADVTTWEIDSNDNSVGERIIRILDPIMGFIIFTNAVIIGVSLDYDDPPEFEILEYLFVTIYVGEVLFKLAHFGPSDFFLGVEWTWHWFDTVLAITGLVDVMCSLVDADIDLGPLMYLRLSRVCRLVRLVRLMRAFKDLSIMVVGLLSGLKTMMWVMLILILVVYSLAVVLTATVGKDESFDLAYREELFSTISRSMFTIFVCLTDGCANYDGTPISLHLFDRYGTKFFIAYCFAIVVVTFGLFNLIMAIFVENTMEAAKSNDTAMAAARHKENLRVARKLKLVLGQFTVASNANRSQRWKALHDVEKEMKQTAGLRGFIRRVSRRDLEEDNQGSNPLAMDNGVDDFQLSRAQFEAVLSTRAVQLLMDELEIDEVDRRGLFEVLDSDSSGSVTIEELVSGLMAVRGQAKKSDTVATMLAVKSVQKSLRSTAALLLQNHHWLEDRMERLESSCAESQRSCEHKLDALERSVAGLAGALVRSSF